MLNLLKKDQKDRILREYRIRFCVIALALAFASEIISLILLTPSFITARTRINILNSQSASLKVQNLNAESSHLGNIVQQTTNYLSALNSSTTPLAIVAAFQNILEVRTAAVRISSFAYKANNGQQQIAVSGTASSRQSLLDFAKKLKTQPGVVSADLPVSDFAKAQNIDFSINIVMKPQNI